MPFELDYEQLIYLDAESLAEAGIAEAYRKLWPGLSEFVERPEPIEEILDNEIGIYSVRFREIVFAIYSPDLKDGYDSWTRATITFFRIVNDQLATSTHRLFAINGGNDLGGLFLTPTQAIESRDTLPRQSDWPYIPEYE